MLRKLLTVIETGVPLLTTATLGRFKSSLVALSERLSIRFARGLKKPSRTADQIWGSRLSTVVVLLPNGLTATELLSTSNNRTATNSAISDLINCALDEKSSATRLSASRSPEVTATEVIKKTLLFFTVPTLLQIQPVPALSLVTKPGKYIKGNI